MENYCFFFLSLADSLCYGVRSNEEILSCEEFVCTKIDVSEFKLALGSISPYFMAC